MIEAAGQLRVPMPDHLIFDMNGSVLAVLSQIEGGQRDGSFETMRKIAEALNISLDELA